MAILKGEGSMTNVPIHGTIEMKAMTQKNGTVVNKALINAQVTQEATAAQSQPQLVRHKYKDAKTGEDKYGSTQIGSESQFNEIKKAAGANCVELTDKDGKGTGKYAFAVRASLTPSKAGDGLAINTAKPMSTNELAEAGGFAKDPRAFMANQRAMAKEAYNKSLQYAEENGIDPKKERDKLPVTYDVSQAMAEAAAKAPEAAAETKAPRGKRTRKAPARKVPEAPAAEAPTAEAEAEVG